MFLGLQDRLWLLAFGAFVALLGALVLPAWLLAGLTWLLLGGGAPAAVVIVEVLALWAVVLYARARVSRPGHLGLVCAQPTIGVAAVRPHDARSAVRVLSGKGVAWKGRTYQ